MDTKELPGLVERLRMPTKIQRERDDDGYPYIESREPTQKEREAADTLESLAGENGRLMAEKAIYRDKVARLGAKQNKLAAENERLREALEYSVCQTGKGPDGFIDWQRCVDRIQNNARKALSGGSE